MNLIVDPLPESVDVDGREYAIRAGFRYGVLFELMMGDPDLTGEEKVAQALGLYYPEAPQDLPAALDRALWFYRCGEDPGGNRDGTGRTARQKAYDFEQDAPYLYAAFLEQYGIDLTEADLHWWKFRALFRSLSADCEFSKIMGYRVMDLKGLPKGQRRFYADMKKLHALDRSQSVEAAASLAQRDAEMREYVSRRFAEVGKG